MVSLLLACVLQSMVLENDRICHLFFCGCHVAWSSDKGFNNGDMLRDFTYIDDIVEGVLRVIDHIPTSDINWNAQTPNPSSSIAPYKIYNIGNSHPVKLMDFIQAIEEVIGRSAEKVYLPMQPGDVYQTNADTTALQNELGFKPSKQIKES